MREQPKALIYTRTATDPASSIAGQEAACREFAVSNGLAVKAVYSDSCVSGNTLGPELQKLLSYISTDETDCHLIVTEANRLGRSLEIHASVMKQLSAANVTVHYAD